MTRAHVAIVGRDVAPALLSGLKRIETRFYRHQRTPWGEVTRGDTVYFKLSGGPVLGVAQVSAVKQVMALTPAGVGALRRRFNAHICAPASYWAARRRSRFGILIWFGSLGRPAGAVDVPRQYGSGWVVLGH